ncbi:hypothetical protein HRR83_009516 [Exophiala dermatitidis]|uniref:F-box domain-containing protein n=2 Tax=Exophiala dermatitidis TaxID=5970 RepID=H6BUA3_EXODN|nr:uncharacterized protein HMPREF1120_02996 [Exophiala dermatitidis NIH/UT8656]KAJ4502186.1 hypothetical protein HRR73_009530 [Exophiala dermatitidis]EHY54833.1 hypothetical protein HMPREF1120_02996 [Exophiala dermatitidis NIH/UT8656]KAJ4502505.1 hypothetical protein HRR74_009559 [Exophiala dermatitidis]KAJ4530323.1 hypothetical protein HRR77_009514 [Exophiala dermatitidis]KAJ4539712.1 hypothetical protein HRR76_003152 [Exophiala dermatitidis]
MAIQRLAAELIVRIFESLTSVSDILNLSLSCHYFNGVLTKSQKLGLFFNATDKEMGPIGEIIQLLTQNNAQLLHIQRSPPLSQALLSQVNAAARVADRIVKLYPSFRWVDAESAQRRLLTDSEARRLRRAVYRFWSYTQAFHSPPSPLVIRPDQLPATERLHLLRSWSTEELYDLEDLRCVLEHLISSEICPTDGDVYSRHPEDVRLPRTSAQYVARSRISSSCTAIRDAFHSTDNIHEMNPHQATTQEMRFRYMQGWGSELHNYYLVQSFLKCSPKEILWLFDNAIYKEDVEQFLEFQKCDPYFFESGSMLFQDWVAVMHARGIDVQKAREGIWDGHAGIVRRIESTSMCGSGRMTTFER